MNFVISKQDELQSVVDYVKRKWPLTWRNLRRAKYDGGPLGAIEVSTEIKTRLQSPLECQGALSVQAAGKLLAWEGSNEDLFGLVSWLIKSNEISGSVVRCGYIVSQRMEAELREMARAIRFPAILDEVVELMTHKSNLSLPAVFFRELFIDTWGAKVLAVDGETKVVNIFEETAALKKTEESGDRSSECVLKRQDQNRFYNGDLARNSPQGEAQLVKNAFGGELRRMESPEWLVNRDIPGWVRETFAPAFEDVDICSFGDVTPDLLRQLWPKIPSNQWYALCHVLGLFGITFDGKLQHLTPALSPEDRIIQFLPESRVQSFFILLDTRCPGASRILESSGIRHPLCLDWMIESRVEHLIGRGCSIRPVLEKVSCRLVVPGGEKVKEVPITKGGQPESSLNLVIRRCLEKPTMLKLYAMGFDPPFYLPNPWRKFVAGKARFANLPTTATMGGSLVTVAQSPISMTLLSLGFVKIDDLPVGWHTVLSLYLPERLVDQSAPNGRSSLRFKWNRRTIGYEPEWSFRVPAHLADITLASILGREPRFLDRLNDAGVKKFSDLTSRCAADFPNSVLANLFTLGSHPAPQAELYQPVNRFRATYDALSRLASPNCYQQFEIKKRDWQITVERLTTEQTLEEIGQKYDVTRERIRQIVRRVSLRVRCPIQLATVELVGALAKFGGIVTRTTFYDLFRQDVDGDALAILLGLVGYAKKLFVDLENSVVSSVGREKITFFLSSGVEKVKQESPIDEAALRALLASLLDDLNLKDPSLVGTLERKLRSEGLVQRPDGKFVLGREPLNERFARAFKELFPNGLAIYKESKRLVDEFRAYFGSTAKISSERSVQGALTNNPNIVLTARGTYMHLDNLNVDHRAVDLAVSECEKMFSNGVSRFNLSRVFGERRENFYGFGVTTVELLHALVRRAAPKSVGLARAPYVFDKKLDDVPRTKELENFIFNSRDRRVCLDEIVSEFVERRGWKEFSVSNGLANSDQITNYDYGVYGLSQGIELDVRKLEDVAEYLETRTRKTQGRVELKIIQEDRPILWAQLGSHPMPFIWNKLKEVFPDRFLYLPAAAVAAPDSSYVNRAVDMSNFLRAAGRPVYIEELKEHFIRGLGWPESAYYNSLSDETNLKYSTKSYIHRNLLNWSPEKGESLEETLLELLATSAKELDWPFLTYRQIVEPPNYSKLPSLPDSLIWSDTLVASLCQSVPSVIPVGTALVRNGNRYGINDFDDLLAYLLAKHFGGAANEALFMDFLRQRGVYSGTRVPHDALNPGSSVKRNESGEVFLSEQGHRRFARFLAVK